MKAEWLKYKLYVFDLDDTLYRETDYLFAAYGRIGAYLAGGDAVKAQEYTRFLCDSFKQDGRQGLFQRLSERYTLHVPTEQLLGILRSTSCPLEMYEPMRQVLDELLQAGKQVMILTNGNPQQQQQKITNLRLFHNHMSIDLVMEVFGDYNKKVIFEIRESIFKNFASSDNYGMIFTYIWAFDSQDDWDYIEHVKNIFRPYGTEFYYIELVSSQKVRLDRNSTENRKKFKSSKNDIELSRNRILYEDQNYRTVSKENEILFENYLKINNENISAKDVALIVKKKFDL